MFSSISVSRKLVNAEGSSGYESSSPKTEMGEHYENIRPRGRGALDTPPTICYSGSVGVSFYGWRLTHKKFRYLSTQKASFDHHVWRVAVLVPVYSSSINPRR
ncbi:MAG TPA: hypothetical protein VJJ02_05225 [Candidatus Paceibacterota bacterium]